MLSIGIGLLLYRYMSTAGCRSAYLELDDDASILWRLGLYGDLACVGQEVRYR